MFNTCEKHFCAYEYDECTNARYCPECVIEEETKENEEEKEDE